MAPIHRTSPSGAPHERLRPPVQLGDPSVLIQARHAVSGFELAILPDADTHQPGCATDPKALALPSTLHHPRIRVQSRHADSLAPPLSALAYVSIMAGLLIRLRVETLGRRRA